MSSSRKLTKREEALRQELVELEERVRMKIRRITVTHQKLPYERLARGREIKETVLLAIQFLDKGDGYNLDIALDRIESLGISLKNN